MILQPENILNSPIETKLCFHILTTMPNFKPKKKKKNKKKYDELMIMMAREIYNLKKM